MRGCHLAGVDRWTPESSWAIHEGAIGRQHAEIEAMLIVLRIPIVASTTSATTCVAQATTTLAALDLVVWISSAPKSGSVIAVANLLPAARALLVNWERCGDFVRRGNC